MKWRHGFFWAIISAASAFPTEAATLRAVFQIPCRRDLDKQCTTSLG
ncbi:hypothetical protein COLO4_06177 [Corchorus olitorius]|uniref:Uncharacterized protein n=1 Tax=Corchorus olitorius TaxID=93759 RepID=A0A1R3KNP6_9ROSI|nr:hypothetical protein COLO4_06177 [Corchorus olitorius]